MLVMNVWSSCEWISSSQDPSLWHSSVASSHPHPPSPQLASVWKRTQPRDSDKEIQPGGQEEYWAVTMDRGNKDTSKAFIMRVYTV